MLEHGDVVGGMSGASTHLIVGEDNIHTPVQAVLNTPVSAYRPQEAIGIGGETRKIVALLKYRLALDLAL